MIQDIVTIGRYLQAYSVGNTQTYLNPYSGALGVGDVRYNTSSHMLETYDGARWHSIVGGTATMSLSPEAESLLDWAREERNKQWEMEALAKSNPAVAIAIDNLNKAKAQLETTIILSKEHTV